MDKQNSNKSEQTNKQVQPDKLLDNNTNEDKPTKRIRKQATQEQLDNPFHGVKLAQILERLVTHYGWEYLGDRTNLRCFIYNPTMKSSLGFLRRTTWAREHVEDIYLEMVERKRAQDKILKK
ncbi:VF530 family protein [Lacinutrix undariae]